MTAVRAHAFARAGLVGNPSDLYGGAGIGFTFDAFRAEVELADAAEWSCPSPLLEAALAEAADLEQPPGAFRFTSDVPRQAGLAGSSAIVIAALRALAARAGRALPPSELAERAWRAENERLGIRSGPMDRLVQAHGGLLRMDFATPFAPGACAALDPALLPPLLLAWDPEPGRASGQVHDEVWARWQAGDAEVRRAMDAFRPLVEQAAAALAAGDRPALKRCVDANFELRAAVFPIGPRDRRMIELGRAAGAAAKFCGSGGAVLLVLDGSEDRAALGAALGADGFRCLEPRVVAAGEGA
jgi:glucuronokinase